MDFFYDFDACSFILVLVCGLYCNCMLTLFVLIEALLFMFDCGFVVFGCCV